MRNISEITRANRYGCPFSVAFLDLDDFKGINDRFGHGAGDRLLRQITDAIQTSIRSSDMIGRLGGDEFAVLFPETSQLAV
ncbi:MAG: GGDEF domain-containing protein [Candidatus Methylumidiphilus sp.]